MSNSEIKGVKLRFDGEDATCVADDAYENCLTGPCEYAEIIDNDGCPQLICQAAELPVFSYLWDHGGCPERKWDKCQSTTSTNTRTKD
jgi:hypothetical protein